jgi:hypothetical protein
MFLETQRVSLKNMDKPKNTFYGDTIGVIPTKLVLSTFFYPLND